VISRRTFLGGALATAAAAHAAPSEAPLGVYLDLTKPPADLPATFRRIAASGYREIEIAGLRDRRPADLRQLLDAAGLSCKSICWEMWENDADSQDTIDAAVELGIEFLVTALPSLMGKEWFETEKPPAGHMTLNDWRWNADWFNHVGGLAQKNNLQFVYRTHAFDFDKLGDSTGFHELYRRTEPTRVKFELDVATAPDPAAFLKEYGARTYLFHVKHPADLPRLRALAPELRHAYLV
jgi:sugar phosphate isomerase/epimerase